MSADPMDLLCEHCGHTFSAFLQEMAEQNAKLRSSWLASSFTCGYASTSSFLGQ
jgi:hypothetical protein